MATPRTNLLLLMTDQQRGDTLGCAGHPVCETPWLDQLASQGARFAHAYSAVPSCIPARSILHTGMTAWNCGQLGYVGLRHRDYPHTLAGELTAAGYQTICVGKLHVWPQRAHWGFERTVLDESSRVETPGFQSDYLRWFEAHREGAYGYRDHGLDWNSWVSRPSHLPEHLHPTHWTAQQSLEFLQQRDPTRPFFLFTSFARPHSPFDPPEPYFRMYDGRADLPPAAVGSWADQVYPFPEQRDLVNAWRAERTPRETARARAGYYGSVTCIDHQIGRLLYELQRLRLDQTTTIVFCSDHGDMLGDHHLWRKTYAYEGSARVPFLVRPAPVLGLAGGQVVEQPVELRDILPTLLESAGVPLPDLVDGRSVLPLLRGETAGWRDYLHGEHATCYHPAAEHHYVTDGCEKLVWLPRADRLQFFDLTADPLETRDLAADPASADRVARWTGRLVAELEPRGLGLVESGRLVAQTDRPVVRLSPLHERYERPFEAPPPPHHL
ncbi:MAG: arylsulfatase [Fimbriimonadaceae bacterium]|nr:arylsulfatase [Fimbriimonadaceae bacterium]